MVGGAPCPVEVMVAGVPDERSGEELVAWLRLRPGVVREAEAAREIFRSRVARFEIPRSVLFADALPMTVTGKPQKFKLREPSITRLAAASA